MEAEATLVRPPDEGETPDPLPYPVDYRSAYTRHLKRNQAHQAGNSHAAMHLIVGVSPEWFERPDGTHEGHDVRSEKVRKLTRSPRSGGPRRNWAGCGRAGMTWTSAGLASWT